MRLWESLGAKIPMATSKSSMFAMRDKGLRTNILSWRLVWSEHCFYAISKSLIDIQHKTTDDLLLSFSLSRRSGQIHCTGIRTWYRRKWLQALGNGLTRRVLNRRSWWRQGTTQCKCGTNCGFACIITMVTGVALQLPFTNMIYHAFLLGAN